jgi:hypothetical protein
MARRTREQEVMELAVDLHAQALAAAEQDAKDRSLAVAAGEVGVPPEVVARAAVLVDERRRAEVARAQKQRRRGAIAAGALLAMAATVWLAWPAPVPVIVEGFDGATARWSLDKNSESTAAVRTVAGERGEALAIGVTKFGAAADGKYHVNVDRRLDLPPLDRHRQVTLRVRGSGLGVVRLFLEGDGTRWRSPPIEVRSGWESVTLPLSTFERQERGEGGFRVVGRGDVGEVRSWSLKVGHFMNPVEAAGEIEIDELRFE